MTRERNVGKGRPARTIFTDLGLILLAIGIFLGGFGSGLAGLPLTEHAFTLGMVIGAAGFLILALQAKGRPGLLVESAVAAGIALLAMGIFWELYRPILIWMGLASLALAGATLLLRIFRSGANKRPDASLQEKDEE